MDIMIKLTLQCWDRVRVIFGAETTI